MMYPNGYEQASPFGRIDRRYQHGVVSAFIGTAFAQPDAEAARKQWRQVADHLRPKVKKLAEFMDEAENDVLAYMDFPASPAVDHERARAPTPCPGT